MPKRPAGVLGDVRGGVRLVIDGVHGVTGIVETLHQRIAGAAPPWGSLADRPARGIAGLVYRGVHGTTHLVGKGLDAALAGMQALLETSPRGQPGTQAAARRDALVAAINGVVGDHLERTANPLAIEMQLLRREDGRDAAALPLPSPHVLLLIHGLCMNDRQWTRGGHDHGQALAQALGCTPVYARYNSGRHVSTNGRELGVRLEQLLRDWPVPVQSLTVIGHSMGGLVARSAVHQAMQAGVAWPHKLRHLVFLGTPHHGAPLERGGNWLHRGLGLSPYLAPFTRLSGLRSAGITDLRHGNLLDEDWADGRFAPRDSRRVIPLPAGVACYAVAGTLGPVRNDRNPAAARGPGRAAAARSSGSQWLGDGLVPLASALGRHPRPTRDLRIPASHSWTARGINHLDLLASDAVYQRLRGWLSH
jgi:hypothetical protein